MNQDQNTVRHMASLFDGVLIEFAVASRQNRVKAGKDALLIGWECDDRTHLWLEAALLANKGWHIDVLAEPIDSPRPELFPGRNSLSGRENRPRPVSRNSSITGVNRVFRRLSSLIIRGLEGLFLSVLSCAKLSQK